MLLGLLLGSFVVMALVVWVAADILYRLFRDGLGGTDFGGGGDNDHDSNDGDEEARRRLPREAYGA